MSRKPSRVFLVCTIPLLATAAAGAWAWQKANSAPMHVRAHSSFFELLRYENEEHLNLDLTPEERAKTRPATQDMMKKLTAEFPALHIAERPVPDAENAFLLIYQLSNPINSSGLPIGQEFRQFLDDESPWDAERAARHLDEHAALVSQIEHIASLNTRSSANMPDDYVGFISGRVAMESAKILLIKARLAAEVGNEQEALRFVAATANFAAHYREIEERTLLGETIAILIEMRVHSMAFEHLLPALGRDADLVRWKTALDFHDHTPADFAEVMRREWNVTSRYYLLPFILRKGHRDTPPDPEKLARAYAVRFNDAVKRLPDMSLGELLTTEFFRESIDSSLSKKGQLIMGEFMIGSRAFAKGCCRTACVSSQYQAALDLLILEKSGTVLVADSVSKVTLDPLTGSPFTFDPATREVSLPANAGKELEVKPIRLPF